MSVEVTLMVLTTAEEIYEQLVKPLPAAERLRLVEKIVHDLSQHPAQDPAQGPSPQRYDWMSVRGIAPGLLEGEYAQGWVSRRRRD